MKLAREALEIGLVDIGATRDVDEIGTRLSRWQDMSCPAAGGIERRDAVAFAAPKLRQRMTMLWLADAACDCRKSHPAILMMKAAQDRHAENMASRLDSAP